MWLVVNYRLFSQFSELADAISNDVFLGDVIVDIKLYREEPRSGWGLQWKSGKTKDTLSL